jgi:hypothetical protein
MLREDSHADVWQADVLLVHEGVVEILYRQRTEARRHDTIHKGWGGGIQGDAGVNGGVYWSRELGAQVVSCVMCTSITERRLR